MILSKHEHLLNQINEENKNREQLHRDDHALLIDGMNLFLRSFSAIPTLNDDGIHIGGLSGFLQSLVSSIKLINPTRVVIVFDGKGGSQRRKKLYSNYKHKRAINSRLNRVVGFDDIVDEQTSVKYQLFRVFLYLQNLPLTIISIDHIEADDVIAYLSQYLKFKKTILSNDKDFLQLVSNDTHVYSPTKKKTYNPENLLEETGIWSENYGIYKALLGDKSDNISGIRGLGDKKIKKYFPQLGNKIKIHLDDILQFCKLYDGSSKTMSVIKEDLDSIILNYRLVQLYDLEISESYKSIIRHQVDSGITELNKSELNKLYVQDKLYSAIINWESWVNKNFTNLNVIRNRYAR